MNLESKRDSMLAHPAWSLLLLGVPFFIVQWGGPIFYDDAYITFRYAENIAMGHGFVYNIDSAPLLGTTTPFYCLLLAALRIVGIPVTFSALAVGGLAAALAPFLLWRIGIAGERPLPGLVAGLALAISPTWLYFSKIGMESSLAGALAMAAILFHCKKFHITSGVICSLTVLTRPDTAALPVLLFLFLLFRDRRGAVRFALGGTPLILAWTVYGFMTFGSPLPHSLAVKRMIHYFPWTKSLLVYAFRFFAFRRPVAMCAISGSYIIGSLLMLRHYREWAVIALWPPLFILGLAANQIVPLFSWYEVPVIPAVYLGSAYLFWDLSVRLLKGLENRGWSRAGKTAALSVFLPIIISLAQHFNPIASLVLPSESMEMEINRIRFDMCETIKERTRNAGRPPSSVKVAASDVGAVGYALMGYYVIDLSGLNSREVYELRKRELDRMEKQGEEISMKVRYAGTKKWVMELVELEEPDYVVSSTHEIFNLKLLGEDGLKKYFELARMWNDSRGRTYVLLNRKTNSR